MAPKKEEKVIAPARDLGKFDGNTEHINKVRAAVQRI